MVNSEWAELLRGIFFSAFRAAVYLLGQVKCHYVGRYSVYMYVYTY